MADAAAATEQNEARRLQILSAAAELIAEAGVAETRIADVAKRAEVSSALVIYYFGTRDQLLVNALRFSEQTFYDAAERMLADVRPVRKRLSLLIRQTCTPHAEGEVAGAWGLWFDLWVQAFRHPEVSADRIDLDNRWRAMIAGVVEAGVADGEATCADPARFAVTFASLLDGLSIQVALADPVVTPDLAYDIAMSFAARELSLRPEPARARKRVPASRPHSPGDADSRTRRR
jgi:AcrR family transcriptional regulator